MPARPSLRVLVVIPKPVPARAQSDIPDRWLPQESDRPAVPTQKTR